MKPYLLRCHGHPLHAARYAPWPWTSDGDVAMPRNVRKRVDRVRVAVREIFMERWQNVLEQAFREELEGEEIRLLIHVLLGALTFERGDDLSEEHRPRLNVSEDSPEDRGALGRTATRWSQRHPEEVFSWEHLPRRGPVAYKVPPSRPPPHVVVPQLRPDPACPLFCATAAAVPAEGSEAAAPWARLVRPARHPQAPYGWHLPVSGKKYGCAKEVDLPLSLADQEEGWRDREEYAVQRDPGLLDTPKPEVPLLSRWPLVSGSLLERQPQFLGLIYCQHWCAECGDRLCARVCIPWVESHFPHYCTRCYVRSESTMESSLDTTGTEPYAVSRAGEERADVEEESGVG